MIRELGGPPRDGQLEAPGVVTESGEPLIGARVDESIDAITHPERPRFSYGEPYLGRAHSGIFTTRQSRTRSYQKVPSFHTLPATTIGCLYACIRSIQVKVSNRLFRLPSGNRYVLI